MLRLLILAIAIVALIFAYRWFSHSAPRDARPQPPEKAVRGSVPSAAHGWPVDLAPHVGNKVSLSGRLKKAKLGMVLESFDGKHSIWIDDGSIPKRMKWDDGTDRTYWWVVGTVIARDDVPAHIAKPGEKPRADIPVKKEELLKMARRRYLLADVDWFSKRLMPIRDENLTPRE